MEIKRATVIRIRNGDCYISVKYPGYYPVITFMQQPNINIESRGGKNSKIIVPIRRK